MVRLIIMVIISVLIAMPLFAESDLKLSFGAWDFDMDETELGLDVSVGAGFGMPLNLNDKPAEFDIGENYDAVAPTIIARAGLGAYNFGSPNKINGMIAVEYAYSAYESETADLTFNAFGVSNSFFAHPAKHLSIRQGSGSGFYILSSDPDQNVTGTFADYSSDVESRTGTMHLYSAKELGVGFYLGDSPFVELTADVRMDTYYPRYIFWPEFARGMVYSAIEGSFNGIAKGTDVWAIGLIGPVVTTAMELFNLNLYPDKVGETHQHIFTPALNLTFHF